MDYEITLLADKTGLKWHKARLLHWHFRVETGDEQFAQAVKAVNFVKDKYKMENSNVAYKKLAAAKW